MPILMPKNLMSFVPLERYKLYEGSANPNIFELLNLPAIIECELDYDKIINEKLIEGATSYYGLLNYYYNCGGSGINEERFAEGRSKLIVEPNKTLHLYKCTFTLYSRFFYNRTAQLDRLLSEISFKEPYQILAKRIAEYIGKFRIYLLLSNIDCTKLCNALLFSTTYCMTTSVKISFFFYFNFVFFLSMKM